MEATGLLDPLRVEPPRRGDPLDIPRGALAASLEPFVPDLRRVIGENSPLPLCYVFAVT